MVTRAVASITIAKSTIGPRPVLVFIEVMVHHSSVPHSASPTRIALAAQASLPHLNADDRRLVPAFAARGVHATAVVWDDPAIDWSTFDAVVIRSCWDYHLRHDTFLDWVARLERAG